MKDLRALPKIRDSWSFLYLEHCRVDKEAQAIAAHDEQGMTPIPCAALALLMLGPGTTVTHAAMRVLAESGCSVAWVGEHGVRCYAQGLGETRSSSNLLRQARLWADPEQHLQVVRRMYAMRFPDSLPPNLTLQQIRGYEGQRVREAYAVAAREAGVDWHGRSYDRAVWGAADPLNRALSAANSCLYGVCHAAILSAGYSPALGFIHTGKQLSFVYDIADLYKTETTIPAAFRVVAEGTPERDLEACVRYTCRDLFHARRLLARVVADIGAVLATHDPETVLDEDTHLLWDIDGGEVSGGVNYAAEG